MPICTNPSCGEISKTKTRFCPHCGQDSLSYVNKDLFSNPDEVPLTTETFDRETYRAAAPDGNTSKKKSKVWSLFKKRQQRDRNLKYHASLALFILFAVTSIFAASPGSLKDSVFQKFGFQEEFSTDFQEDQKQFKFLDFSDNSIPIYFKGCESIDYYVRQNYSESGDLSIISTALSTIGNGIGRDFIFKGLTTKQDVSELPSNSVLINFTSYSEYKAITKEKNQDHEDSSGLGGPESLDVSNKPRFDSWAATSGNIWINQQFWPSMKEDEKLILIMHEMGHVLGLDHPTNGLNQIMDDDGNFGTSLGSGDLMGLKILSALAGCRKFPAYLTGSDSQKKESVAKVDQDTASDDVYIGVDSKSGGESLNRALISSAQNSCGNNFPDSIQNLNSEIPSTWRMIEFDGCGSGRTYNWSNPKKSKEFVELHLSGSSGWCQNIGPDDVDGIAAELAGDVSGLERASLDSGRFIYGYSRSSTNTRQDVFGLIEVGSAYQWCDGGFVQMEVGVSIRTNEEFFNKVLTTVFGQY